MRERHTFIAIALLSLLSVAAAAQDQDGYDFRKTRWGMTPAQVKASETLKPEEEAPETYFSNTITYSTKVVGRPVKLVYYFINDELAGTAYTFQTIHSENNPYINDFNEVNKILNSKYGEPLQESKIWERDTYKNSPKDYGLAVSVGDLTLQNIWKTKTEYITLKLTLQNNNIMLGVMYISAAHNNLMYELKEKYNKKDL